jgi:dyslexia susceptibility 1 candidate gene 1 protein
MTKVPASKVDVFLSETFIRVNAQSIKLVLELHLYKPIDYNAQKTRQILGDEGLELYLIKTEPEEWPQLCYADTKENLRKRAQESEMKVRKEEDERRKIAQERKQKMEQDMVKRHIEADETRRKQIKDKKEEEKTKAEKEVYDTFEKLEAVNKAPLVSEVKSIPSKQDIFTATDIKSVTTVVAPTKVREQAIHKIGFTEKKYPLLAARETQLKEPPLPKAAMQAREKKNEPLSFEEKNPLWLKEKGDNFFNNNDYVSALNAYNKSIEGDSAFLKCYLNRATCYLKLRAYKNCIQDCDRIEELLDKQKKDEDPEFYDKMGMRAYVKKAAALCWQGEFDQALGYYDKALEFSSRMSEKESEVLKKDIEKIKTRSESLKRKEEADNLLKEAKLLEALEEYKAIEDHNNEYIYANMSLAYLKLGQYEQCIECVENALRIIRNFQADTYRLEPDHRLEVKLLLRRGKSYDALKRYKEAKNDLDFCVMYEPGNSEVVGLLKTVQQNLNREILKEAKEAGQKLQIEKKFAEALEKYEECLKVTKKETSLDNISIYINKIACLLPLGKHEKAIQDSEVVIRLIQKYKNKFTSSDSQDKSEKERLGQMEIRLYMRRANAYANLQKINQAIDSAKKALELDPNNEIIKADIRKLEGN